MTAHSPAYNYTLQIPPVYAEQLSPSSKGTDPLYIYLNVSILALPDIRWIVEQCEKQCELPNYLRESGIVAAFNQENALVGTFSVVIPL